MRWNGIIIKESLLNSQILESLPVKYIEVTDEEKDEDRWHIYNVLIDEEQIPDVSSILKDGPWYCHFWNNKEMQVVYKNKIFRFGRLPEGVPVTVKTYGELLGIPEEQLDFTVPAL